MRRAMSRFLRGAKTSVCLRSSSTTKFPGDLTPTSMSRDRIPRLYFFVKRLLWERVLKEDRR